MKEDYRMRFKSDILVKVRTLVRNKLITQSLIHTSVLLITATTAVSDIITVL